MTVNKNKFEVNLLLNDPPALVTHYQSIISIVVTKFIVRGFFNEADKMDVIQNINEALLARKIHLIQKNYNGSVLLSTYFSKVIYNHCLEISRSQKNRNHTGSELLLRNVSDATVSPLQKLALRDEVNRLSIILNAVIGLSLRLRIALRLFARATITLADFQGELVSEDDLFENFKSNFFGDYNTWNDKEVYEKAIPFLNKLTGKNTDADSMRKWLNLQVDRIVELQNGQPPRSFHNRETIKILLQMYFER